MSTKSQSSKSTENEIPTLLFPEQKDWADWLRQNHAKSSGVWLKLAKKASGRQSVSYAEALEVALCYGWIDGQKQSDNESFWLQKFTPRGAKSIWSKINKAKAGELIKSGRMKPAGLNAVERAKQDGRWEKFRRSNQPDAKIYCLPASHQCWWPHCEDGLPPPSV